MMSKTKYMSVFNINKTDSLLLLFNSESDIFGVVSSSLCLVHCIVTPLIFVVHATSVSCADVSPYWWKMIDYTFLLVSFGAIYHTTKQTVLNWIPYALFGGWMVLAILILNEAYHLISLPHMLVYIPSLSLAFLHLYNRRYCKCNGKSVELKNNFRTN